MKINILKPLIITLLVLSSKLIMAQDPICNELISACGGNTSISNFRAAQLFSGTPLSVGAKYKFRGMFTENNGQKVDGICEITKISNARLLNIDDDSAISVASGLPVSALNWFSPIIRPDVDSLGCTNRTGYIEFKFTFYKEFTGTTLPNEKNVNGLNFVHYDMDGGPIGNGGWYKEIGYEQYMNANNPILLLSPSSELTNLGVQQDNFYKYMGSSIERNGYSQCAEVALIAKYINPQSSISFRMGYDYKAPTDCSANTMTTPARQYVAKFDCVGFPPLTILPLKFLQVSAALNAGLVTVNWKTAEEQSLKQYDIERSTDGINFSKIGSTSPKNAILNSYDFNDNINNNANELFYYRIVAINLNGDKDISPVATVKKLNDQQNKISIFPNPSYSGSVQIRLTSNKAESAMLSVFDATGKRAIQKTVNLLKGVNSIILNDIATLSSGSYNVVLQSSSIKFSSKLIIW